LAVGFAITYLFGVISPIFLCTRVLEWLFGRPLRADAFNQAKSLQQLTARKRHPSEYPHILQPYATYTFENHRFTTLTTTCLEKNLKIG
jgi:hypothetical protein